MALFFNDWIIGLVSVTQPYAISDYFVVVQNGETKKLPGNQVATINDSQVLSNKVLSSPNIFGTLSGNWVCDGIPSFTALEDGDQVCVLGLDSGGVLVKSSGETLAKVSIVSKTGNYTLLSTDSGKYFDNTGASAEVDLTLPSWAVGLYYHAVVTAGHLVKIIAPGSAKIAMGSSNSLAGGYVSNAVPFSIIKVFASSVTDQWVVSEATGEWDLE